MVTRKGVQCIRPATEGGLGFCWQHVPVDSVEKREKWKTGIERLALVLSATEVVIKIGELAVQYLHALFGDGDPVQTQARSRLEDLLFDQPRIPELPESFPPGSRVNWKSLEEFVREAAWIRDHASEADPRALPWLEAKFNDWYEGLSDYHRTVLLDKIEALSVSSKGLESDA